jgi:hypothetical protein
LVVLGVLIGLLWNRAAVRLLQQALAIDPSYAPAAGLVGWCYCMRRVQGWISLEEAEVVEGVRLAKAAIEMGQDDPDALWMAGVGTFLGMTDAYLGMSVDDNAPPTCRSGYTDITGIDLMAVSAIAHQSTDSA